MSNNNNQYSFQERTQSLNLINNSNLESVENNQTRMSN